MSVVAATTMRAPSGLAHERISGGVHRVTVDAPGLGLGALDVVLEAVGHGGSTFRWAGVIDGAKSIELGAADLQGEALANLHVTANIGAFPVNAYDFVDG